MAALTNSDASSLRISVVIRVRPMNGTEQAHSEISTVECDEETGTIAVGNSSFGDIASFTFDRVFGITTEQQNFYKEVAEDLVAGCFTGVNGTILAYGQTGAGKTFSIEGDKRHPGVMPLASEQIFKTVDKLYVDAPNDTFLIRASYLEIHNENVYDLLCVNKIEDVHHIASTPPTILQIREDTKRKNFFAAGLTERVVTSREELNDILHEGAQRRTVGRTNMNAHSSRSHSIMKIWIERAANGGGKDGEEKLTSAVLRVVDLAGSERGDKTGTTGAAAREGSYINKSLSALGDVINELEKKSRMSITGTTSRRPSMHVSYRNSALTKLLSDSLGGNSRTVMIASIGPARSNETETMSTLRFAKRVKSVKNKPKINEDPKDAKLRELQAEVSRLKNAVAGMHVDLPNVEGSSAVMYKQAVENLSQERAVLDTLKNAAEEEYKKLLTDEDELATLRPMEADERQRLESDEEELKRLNAAKAKEHQDLLADEGELHQLKRRQWRAAAKMAVKDAKLEAQKAALSACDEELATLRKQVREEKEEIVSLQKAVNEEHHLREAEEADLGFASTEVEMLRKQIQSQKNEMTRIQEINAKLVSENKVLALKADGAQSETEIFEQQIATKATQAKLSLEAVTSTSELLRRECNQYREAAEMAQKERAAKMVELADCHSEIANLRQLVSKEEAGLSEARALSKKQAQATSAEESELQSKIDSSTHYVKRLEQEVKGLHEQLEKQAVSFAEQFEIQQKQKEGLSKQISELTAKVLQFIQEGRTAVVEETSQWRISKQEGT